MSKPSIYIPPADLSAEASAQAYADFVQIVQRLRKECPWDRKQTNESIKHLLIEETFEAVEAIDTQNWGDLRKELGDLLLHIIFHAVMAEEVGRFDLTGVIKSISEKLIVRHPHIYGDASVENAEEVLRNWEKIKQKEKQAAGKTDAPSILAGVPKHLPALLQAQRIQEKAAGIGFDFPDQVEAWKKVEEELGELKRAVEEQHAQVEIEKEFGDVLFALTNYGRFIQVVPEDALRHTNHKFKRRFAFIEATLAERNQTFEAVSLAEMDAIWDEAKRQGL